MSPLLGKLVHDEKCVQSVRYVQVLLLIFRFVGTTIVFYDHTIHHLKDHDRKKIVFWNAVISTPVLTAASLVF